MGLLPRSRFGKPGQVAQVESITLAPTDRADRANPRQKLRFRQATICTPMVVTTEYGSNPTRRYTMKYLLPAVVWLLKTICTEAIRIALRLALRGDRAE